MSGTILDDQSPLVVGTLAENIRIAVMKSPIVDANIGAAASIRIVNPNHMEKEDFINGGTATVEMLDLLSEFIRYGISVCIAGATSSGKTTVAGWLLTTIPDNKRIFTIENGSRELSLIREKDGRVTNSVVHTLTRSSENELYRIEQIDLVDISLRFNPDIIVVGEMRGAEANAAQEVARTGVAVVTTIHSNSCESTYRRMVSLCKRAVDMSDETILTAVEENLHYLNPLVHQVFRDFVLRVKLIDPDVLEAIKVLRTKIDNEVFREWCDALCDCQHDRSLKVTLTPIVSKLSDMRIVNGELEYPVFEPRKEFFSWLSLSLATFR